MVDQHAALVYTMVLVSASDRDMTDAELQEIGDIVRHWPVFRGYDDSRLTETARACAELLSGDDGLERTLQSIAAAVPERLRETAYALACDIAAADGAPSQEELRVLELLRHRLGIHRLEAAAIERGTRARYMT